jgi:hypothetical protein
MFHPRLIRLPLGIMLVAATLAPAGCSKKDSGEKLGESMTERMLEKATGKKADVHIDGENVSIKTGDANMQMMATNKWPSDMFDVVPRFTYGKVERVTSGVEGGMKKFSVYLRDVPDDASDKYAEELKAAGWEAQMTVMGSKGGMMSAQKGKIGVQFMHGKDDKSGVFVAYEVGD